MRINSLNLSRRKFLCMSAFALFSPKLINFYDPATAMAKTQEVGTSGIFDAHVHISINDPTHYPLNPASESQAKTIFQIAPTAEDFIKLMDANGVEQAALIQHHLYGSDNSYIADSARRYPKRLISVGSLDASEPDALEKMRYWVVERGLGGLRIRGGIGSESAESIRFFESAVELGTQFQIMGSNKKETFSALEITMKRVPKLKIILDHMGDYGGDSTATVNPLLLDAARLPNLYIKFTTHNLRRLSANGGSARTAIKSLVDAFGANRVLWGSDCGNTRVTYPEMVAMAKDAVADLPSADQGMVLSGTAKGLYNRV